jgi:hypothetical protein
MRCGNGEDRVRSPTTFPKLAPSHGWCPLTRLLLRVYFGWLRLSCTNQLMEGSRSTRQRRFVSIGACRRRRTAAEQGLAPSWQICGTLRASVHAWILAWPAVVVNRSVPVCLDVAQDVDRLLVSNMHTRSSSFVGCWMDVSCSWMGV